MESQGIVSVVIPAFNRVNFIDQTVTSVVSQSYSYVETIVVDDGSTDGTWERLDDLRQKHGIKVLTHEGRENRGQSAALNLGLQEAIGEYIAILDSDDLFAPGKLKKQVRFLEENPTVGLVYGMGQAIDGDGQYLYDILCPDHLEPNDPNEVLLDCYFLLPQNALVRRSVFDRVGEFEESFRAAQDHDMLIRIAEVTTMAFIPETLFYYRRHGDSISSNGQELRWRNGFEILRRAAKRYPYRRSTIRKRAAVLNYRLWETYSGQGQRGRAWSHLIWAGLLDPARSVRVLLGWE
jgi:glycosyltransferase involved in cell wall biosynthesis